VTNDGAHKCIHALVILLRTKVFIFGRFTKRIPHFNIFVLLFGLRGAWPKMGKGFERDASFMKVG
jgi:hypothetical protein